MRRLPVIVVGVLAAWLGTAAPVAINPQLIHVYTHDSYPHSSRGTCRSTGRGPPTDTTTTTAGTVDRGSRGVSERPESADNVAAATYTTAEAAVREAGSTTATREQAQRCDGDLSPITSACVAANSGRLGRRIVTEDALGDVCDP